MTHAHWLEFQEKIEFALLTQRWSMLPLHWLDETPPVELDESERRLYEDLVGLREAGSSPEEIAQRCRAFRSEAAGKVITMDPDLCPPGCRVELALLDLETPGEGDCLITVGSWDRVGHALAELAEPDLASSNPTENPLRREPGSLRFRHLLIFPERGTPTPRAFRHLCEKTLRQARVLGARRLTVTHLHLPQPGLPDRFAAAELVSAIRQMMRDNPSGVGLTVRITPFPRRVFEDYLHWFRSLKELYRPTSSSAVGPGRQGRVPEPPGYDQGVRSPDSPWQPGEALKAIAERTSDLAQEAGQHLSRWLSGGQASGSFPQRKRPSFQQQRALNFLYLRRRKEAEQCLLYDRDEGPPEVAVYLQYLLQVLPLEGDDAEREEGLREALRDRLVAVSEALRPEDPLALYYRLAAFRLNLFMEEPELLSSQREALLAEATTWGDGPLERFLEELGEEPPEGWKNSELLGYVPVFPSLTKPSSGHVSLSPQQSTGESHV